MPLFELDGTDEHARAIEAFRRQWDGISPYAIATVVETIGLTSTKPGSRAIVTHDGDLIGFVGGGCVRGALKSAARDAIASGEARLISAVPRDQIAQGANTSDAIYPSSCPSRGEIRLFVEPVLPPPPLVVIGESEIARWVRKLAPVAGFKPHQVDAEPPGSTLSGNLSKISAAYAVIATQGVGDTAALSAAMQAGFSQVLFVASTAKATHVRQQLRDAGTSDTELECLISPAGLNIGAKGPREVALSIIAQIIQFRRSKET